MGETNGLQVGLASSTFSGSIWSSTSRDSSSDSSSQSDDEYAEAELEAEYIALSEAWKTSIYLRGILQELLGDLDSTTIFCANQTAIGWGSADASVKRAKHVQLR